MVKVSGDFYREYGSGSAREPGKVQLGVVEINCNTRGTLEANAPTPISPDAQQLAVLLPLKLLP